MSLRLRRGTDAERQAVTFLEGELVYTTDTKKVFVGDGSTLGGVAIDSALGSIGTLTDVDISGVAIGQVLQWDGSAFVPGSADKESLYGNDSTILVDTISSSINLDGTVKGNIVPDANIAYDLGSASNRFRDLYLSGTSIDLGGTTISVAGGKVNFGAPVQAQFELNQNMDLKNYYITSTDGTPNVSIRPGTDANFNVAQVGGTKLFEVNLDTNTYGTATGQKTVLQLPVFNSADYTSHGTDSALGQVVFDDPSKSLKVYNGSNWVAISGTGGGGTGIVEGQTYEISINGDVIQDDSTILVDTTNGEFKGNLVASNRDVIVSSGADGDASTVTAGTVFAGDLQAETISAVNLEAIMTPGPTRAASVINIGTVTADRFVGDIEGDLVAQDSTKIFDSTAQTINVTGVSADEINSTAVKLSVKRASEVALDLVATGTVDMSGQTSDRGEIFFSRSDTGGLQPEAKIAGGRQSIYMIVDNDSGSFPEANTFMMNNNSGIGGGIVRFGFGIFQPTAKLHVAGNAKLTEELMLGNMDQTAINALTGANGMIVYNTTTNKFQGYENGAWANLI